MASIKLSLVCGVALVPFCAHADPLNTWNGSAGFDYETAANWTPATVPNSGGTDVVFGANAGTKTVDLSTPYPAGYVTVRSVTFDDPGSAYTINVANTAYLSITGNVVNTSGITQNFTVTGDSSSHLASEIILNGVDAGSNVVYTVNPYATVQINSTNGSASAADARFVLNGGGIALSGSGTVALGSVSGSGVLSYYGNPNGSTGTFQIGALNEDTTLAAQIQEQTGSLAIRKVGTGTLTLNGPSTYTGGTRVSGGTLLVGNNAALGTGGLRLGNGTTFGTSGGPVTLANAVTLSQGSEMIDTSGGDLTLTGDIGQAGGNAALTKVGGGTLILTGDATYNGNTTVSAGTLQVGDGGTSGSVRGNIVDTGTVNFDRSDTTTYGRRISGSGDVAQIGAGTLALTGTNTFTGTASVNADGRLQLRDNGSIAAAATVQADGTFDISRHNGGASIQSLSGAGDVALGRNDLTLTEASDTFSGVIHGRGGLTLADGIEVLTGVNTYRGGTRVDGGTLVVSGAGTLGAVTGSTIVTGGILDLGGTSQQQAALRQSGGLVGNGTMNVGTYRLSGGELGADATVNASDAFNVRSGLVSGTLTGSGALTKGSGGIVFLTGTNDYSGGTTIDQGLLVLGDGGTSGSIVGDITNNSALAFYRSDDVAFGGAISGSGIVAQIGAGATRLADGNTYTGGTVIFAGTLIGSATSFGADQIADEAALVIDQGQNANFSNELLGTGTLTKTGAGTLDLVTDSSFSGATTLAQGGLAVNASFANSAFTAQSGTTLSGAGTVGALTVQNGATLATGNSIGTLTVAGNLVQQAGSNWQVQLASTGETDRVNAGGQAQIAPGAILTVTKVDTQPYALNASYTVLTAAGGVTGRYMLAGDTHISTFVDLVGNYDNPNAVVLNAAQTRQFNALAGLTRNQRAAAGGAQSLGLGNPLFNAIAYLGSEGAARNAFDQISGEIYSSAKSEAIEDSRFLREAVGQRLRGATGGIVGQTIDDQTGADSPANATGVSLWGSGFGAWGHLRHDGDTAQLDRSIGGFFLGADTTVGENWRIGVLGGYSHANYQANSRNSSGISDNYHAAAYGGGNIGPIRIQAGAAYTWQKLDTDRSIGFTGFTDALSAKSRAHTAQLFGEASYRVDVNGGAWEPFAQVAYVHLHSNAFAETGGAAALVGASDNTNDTFTTVGLRASKTLTATGNVSLFTSLGWRHAFGDRTPLTAERFASGSDAFTVAGTPIAQDAAALEAGINANLSGGLGLGVAYSGQLSGHSSDNGVKVRIGVKF
jgi:fibronectin-binding autotransporter adhesin